MESTGRWRVGASVVLCGALVSGCGHGPAGAKDSHTAEQGEAAAPATTPARAAGASQAGGAAAGTTIRDDFSNPSSGWTRRDSGARTADYVDGAYVLSADNDADAYVGSEGRYEAREFADTRFEVKATKLSTSRTSTARERPGSACTPTGIRRSSPASNAPDCGARERTRCGSTASATTCASSSTARRSSPPETAASTTVRSACAPVAPARE
jgi:hypothetical protein